MVTDYPEQRFSSYRAINTIHFGYKNRSVNPLNTELHPICYLLALLGAHHFLHVSRIRVKLLTFRLLMSYIYGAPVLDVSRSHTTTQHSWQDSSGRVISSSQRPLPDNTTKFKCITLRRLLNRLLYFQQLEVCIDYVYYDKFTPCADYLL